MQLDIIGLAANSTSRDAFKSKLSNCESSAVIGGKVTYTFFEGVERDKKYTISSLLGAAPGNIAALKSFCQAKGQKHR